jgi:hypothetical protein
MSMKQSLQSALRRNCHFPTLRRGFGEREAEWYTNALLKDRRKYRGWGTTGGSVRFSILCVFPVCVVRCGLEGG